MRDAALELLPRGVYVDDVVLLAGAVDPWRDLSDAMTHVCGRIINSYSAMDFLILGAGTSLFGTGDRTYGPSAGMVGLRHPSADDARVVQIPWRPAMIAQGRLGDHFTAAASEFFARHIAPCSTDDPRHECRPRSKSCHSDTITVSKANSDKRTANSTTTPLAVS